MKQKKYLLPIIIVALLVAVALFGACIDFSKPLDRIDLSVGSEIRFDSDIYAYTGEEIKPQIALKRKNRIVEAQHYTLEYSDNVEPGTATVKVVGTGNYYGELSADFTIGYAYSFDAAGADSYSGELSQIVRTKEDLLPPEVSKECYEFSHWSIDGQRVDLSDLSSLPKAAVLVANYSPIKYNITYHLDGGANDPDNRDAFTVEDVFELKAAAKRGLQFAGWYKDGNFKELIESVDGEKGDLHLYAKFVDFDKKRIYYHTPSGATAIESKEIYPETPLSAPAKQTCIISGRDKKLVWYADVACTVKFFFREMPNEDLHIYARWEDETDRGFLDKVDGFSSINSRKELAAYIDSLCFNNVNDPLDSLAYIPIAYVSSKESVKSEIENSLLLCQYPRTCEVRYQYRANEFKMTLVSGDALYEPERSATPIEDFSPQLGNIFALGSAGRGDDYDKFPIDFIQDVYEVETSDQLFYVMSHGYRPLPKQGSTAEKVYAQFRDIMREICDDSMSDLQKVKAIYEWLILHVYYDKAVAYPDLSTSVGQLAASNPYKFDAFYLEGVLRGAAVCDGLSKAYAVMCAIEGIDCVRVTGEQDEAYLQPDPITGETPQSSGHAWNKVQIAGEWYLSDATWGNQEDKFKEIAFYSYMLFTDAIRSNVDHYVRQNYTDIVAGSDFDYRSFYSSTKLEVGSYTADFLVQDSEELSYILEYIYFNVPADERKGSSFEVLIDFQVTGESKEIVSALNSASSKLRLRNPGAKVDIESIITYGSDLKFAVFIFK